MVLKDQRVSNPEGAIVPIRSEVKVQMQLIKAIRAFVGDVGFSFPKLEILNVKVNQYYEPGDLIKWFGKFKYPVVKSMDTNSKDVRE